MRYSSEPTREMALCLTSEAEQALWCRMANLVGAESSAIRRALETPDRMLENPVHAIDVYKRQRHAIAVSYSECFVHGRAHGTGLHHRGAENALPCPNPITIV